MNSTAKRKELEEAKGRALVIDDNPVNRMVVAQMLERRGLSVDSVSNGKDAIALFSNEHYDLVLLDLNMPEQDGFETAQQIRALERIGKHVPIVALTSSSSSEHITKCRQYGMNAFVTKPLSQKKLEITLSKWVFSQERPTK